MHARRRLFAIVSAAVIPATIFACGSDSKKKPDGSITLDDSNNGGQDTGGGSGGCTASASYGSVTPGGSDQAAESQGSGAMTAVVYDAVLNADPNPDLLQIELYGGFGAFGSGAPKPGTYQITGAEANYETCGVCVRIFTDLSQGSGGAQSADDYFASGGTVTLTSVSGNTFSGTLSNVTFDHVTIDPQTFHSTPVGDCTSSVSSLTMNTPLMMGSAAFTGTIVPVGGKHLMRRHY